jgi:hypothetical protein
MSSALGTRAAGASAPNASTERTKPRICDVTSVRWARSTSAALPGRSWHARSVSKRWSPAPLPERTQSSEWKSHRGAQRFFEMSDLGFCCDRGEDRRRRPRGRPGTESSQTHCWEGNGFEVSVPRRERNESSSRTGTVTEVTKVRLETVAYLPGTDGSNPFPASGESCANLIPRSERLRG